MYIIILCVLFNNASMDDFIIECHVHSNQLYNFFIMCNVNQLKFI